jgi:predicted GNAT family acetyltransferase
MLAAMEAATQIKTHHNASATQFEIHDADAVVGRAEYLEMPESPQRVFFHTVVDDDYQGQGLAMRLAESAVATTIAEGRRIVPICALIAAYLRKHPELADHADEPRGVHRSAVRAVGGDA